MSSWAVLLVTVLLTIGGAGALWRTLRGPQLLDRALAADLVFFVFIGLVALLVVVLNRPGLLILLVVATLLGFIGTLSLALLTSRRSDARPDR